MTTTHRNQTKLFLHNRRHTVCTFVISACVLCACLPIPTLRESPPASDADFNDAPIAPAPQATAPQSNGIDTTPSPVATPDPFNVPEFANIKTVSPFKPVFVLNLPNALTINASPALENSIYQTAKEVELREVRMLLENCRMDYGKLSVGQLIGTITMDIGTPPKARLTGDLRVTDTDKISRATVSAKASNLTATAYVADIRFRQMQEHLSIVSIANFTRANDVQGIHLTERSARITQRLNPSYFLLPPQPGTYRVRSLLYGETDPQGGGAPLRIERSTITVTK